jgi:hypothetical protein
MKHRTERIGKVHRAMHKQNGPDCLMLSSDQQAHVRQRPLKSL